MKRKYSKPKRGKYKIDKTFPFPVGRIQRSSGTHNHEKYTQILQCLQFLWDDQRVDDLIALRDNKEVTPLGILKAWKSNTLQSLNWVEKETPLEESIRNWSENHSTLSTRTKKGYRTCINTLLSHGTDSSISDLPSLLRSYRASAEQSEHFRTFNQTRAVCMAYARDTTEDRKESQLYKDVKKIPFFGRRIAAPTTRHQPFTPVELDLLFNKADPEIRKYENIIWWLCLHGLTSKEFLEDGFVSHPDHIEVLGEKRESRHRLIPKLMEPPEPPFPSYKKLLSVFKALGARTTHDARRSTMVWLDRAGIDRDHGSAYMGHSISTMRSLYKQEDVLNRWIPEDTVKMLEWLKEARKATPPRPNSPVIVAKTASELGENQQGQSLDHIMEELNKVLVNWYEAGWTRRFYGVDQLTDLTEETYPDQ